MVKQRTIVNKFGEAIHIKIENDKIFIHHEDASDEFIGLERFMIDTILDNDELILINGAIKSLAHDNAEFYMHLANQYVDKMNKQLIK